MSQRHEDVLDTWGKAMPDRIRVVGDDLPPAGVLFFGKPKLPLLLYKEADLKGIIYKYAVDAEKKCWAPQSWPGGLNRVSYSEIAGRFLAGDKRNLLEELADALQRPSPVDKCPHCGSIVPRNALV